MSEIYNSHVVIPGGTGFLGQALAKAIVELSGRATILSRHRPAGDYHGEWIEWDGHSIGRWAEALEGAAAVVNLAGRTVDCRKTPDRCDEILRSRVESVRAVGEAIRQCSQPPAVWVQAATAHIYGDPPDRTCDESAPIGYGLAPQVGERWERELADQCPAEMRRVVLRTSFVLGNTGGAYPVLARLARFGLGGKIGNGKQWISWLHVDDFVGIVLQAIQDPGMKGIYNVTSPDPKTNAQFMRSLRKAYRMPIGLPSPEWLIRLGAATFLDTDPELPLYGRNIAPARLLKEGYTFKFPRLEEAIANLTH